MNSIFNISCSTSQKGSPVKSTFANSRTKNLFQVINGRVGKVSQRGPRQRVLVASENSALVFGDATATAATIDDTVLKKREVQKRPLEISVPKTRATCVGEEKVVTLQNYLNILNLIGGLKYQLPVIGSELCCSLLLDLLHKSATVPFGHGLNRSSNLGTQTSSVMTTAFLGYENVKQELYSAANWASVFVNYIQPLVSVLHSSAERFKTGSGSELFRGTGGAGSAGGSSKGGTVNNRLKVCLQLNKLLKRLDQFCNQFVECDTEKMTDDTIVPGEMTSSTNKPEAAVGSNSSSAVRKFLSDIRIRHCKYMQDFTGFDIEHVSLINCCDCCFYSPSCGGLGAKVPSNEIGRY